MTQEALAAAMKGRTFGFAFFVGFLLLPLAPVGLAQGPDSGWKQADPAGDVSATVMGQVNSPGLPYVRQVRHIDLVELSIDDPEPEFLEFRIRNALGFREQQDAALYVFGGNEYHSIVFQVPRTEARPMYGILQIGSYGGENASIETAHTLAYVGFCLTFSAVQDRCNFGWYGLDYRVEEGALVLPLPKLWLTRGGIDLYNVDESGLPVRLRSGDAILTLRAQGVSHQTLFFSSTGAPILGLYDRLPNSGSAPPYILKHDSFTTDLLIDDSQQAVLAGEENVVPVAVSNLAESKRLVNFTIEELESSDESSWTISTTPTLTLSAGETANLTLRVVAPPLGEVTYRWTYFRLRADVLTEPGTVAVGDFFLVAAPPLDAKHSQFYVHSWGNFGSSIAGQPIPLFNYGIGYLNRFENDAAAMDSEKIPFNPTGFGFPGNSRMELAQYLYAFDGIPNPAVFRPGEPVTSHLEIESPIAIDAVQIGIDIFVEDRVVAQATHATSLRQGLNRIDLSFPVAPEMKRLNPSDGSVNAVIRIVHEGLDASAYTLLTFVQSVYLLPKVSWFRLPVDREIVAPPRADLPRVSLAGAEDLEGFVNPGRTQVFEVDLRNDETREVRVEVAAENLSQDWDVRIEPGERFSLGANDSARLGILVDSPADAQEGEIFSMRLVAKLADEGDPLSALTLRSIVTRGVEIENETFELRDEDAEKLEGDGGGASPGPGIWLLSVSLLVGLRVHRRRQG